MPRRRTITLQAVGIATVIAVSIFWFRPSREPTYEGRILSDWLNEYSRGSAEGSKKAKEALRALEPAAIPVMLEWLSYEPPSWREAAIKVSDKLPLPQSIQRRIDNNTKLLRAGNAEFGFSAFGPAKTNAGPALLRIANDIRRGDSAVRAILVLEMNPEFKAPGFDFRSGVTNAKAEQRLKQVLVKD